MMDSYKSIPMETWDAELTAINSDLSAIKRYQHDSQQKERAALISLKVGIFQLQAKLTQLLDRISDMLPQQQLLPSKQRAFLYWAGVYTAKVRDFYAEHVAVLGKEMWLQLVRARVPGDIGGAGVDFSDENLIELSLRYSQLKTSEKMLREHLQDLKNQQLKLKHRYQDISAARANRDAAGSMFANYGRTIREAKEHPLLHRMSLILKGLGQTQRSMNDRYKYVNELHHTIAVQADDLINQCRTLVLANLDANAPAERIHQRELAASLRQIGELREQLKLATDLCSSKPEPARPTIKN